MEDGLLVLNKPGGMTSAEALRQIKRHHKVKKLGHAGTLDPEASGVLLVLFGKATRMQDDFMALGKTYSGFIKLGVSTDSDDVWGNVTETMGEDWTGFSEQEFSLYRDKLIEEFSGEIMQTPPQVSAVKVAGVRAYQKARKGLKVELAARPVLVHELDLEREASDRIRYCLRCGSGTYVRSIARDIGSRLECYGVAESIERVAIGHFTLDNALSLEQVLEAEYLGDQLMPLSEALSFMPRSSLSWEDCKSLSQGIQTPLKDLVIEVESFNGESHKAAEPSDSVVTGKRAVIEAPDGSVFALIELSETGNWKLKRVF